MALIEKMGYQVGVSGDGILKQGGGGEEGGGGGGEGGIPSMEIEYKTMVNGLECSMSCPHE